jgi:hypothetical protein
MPLSNNVKKPTVMHHWYIRKRYKITVAVIFFIIFSFSIFYTAFYRTKKIILNVDVKLYHYYFFNLNSSYESSASLTAAVRNELLKKKPSENNYLQSDIFIKQEFSLKTYFKVLKNSIEIIDIPFDNLHQKAKELCNMYKQGSLINNQHSLELRFPQMLLEMSRISNLKNSDLHRQSDLDLYGILHDNFNNETKNDNNNNINTANVNNYNSSIGEISTDKKPIFYYLKSYLYHMVFCNKLHGEKEEWKNGFFFYIFAIFFFVFFM